MFCSLCSNKGGFVVGHGSMPPSKESTERAQCWCSRVGEHHAGLCFGGNPGCVTVPGIHTCCATKSINVTCCWSAGASPGFLTERSVIGWSYSHFLMAKFLFKELQVMSVKLLDTSTVHCHHSLVALQSLRGGQQAPKQAGSYTEGLHLQPKLGERCPEDTSVTILHR